jgi:hypothetical protein
MAGRPTKLTPERADDLVVLLGSGVPVEVAARALNVSRRTLDAGSPRTSCASGSSEHGPPDVRAPTRSARLAVVLILRAAVTDWRAAASWLERRHPERLAMR